MKTVKIKTARIKFDLQEQLTWPKNVPRDPIVQSAWILTISAILK
jgi:hypothetical protein